MKLLEKHALKVDNLSIEQLIWDIGENIYKEIHVMRDNGEYLEELTPTDPDYTKMIIHLHNHKHK